jgi:hypothetical protein
MAAMKITEPSLNLFLRLIRSDQTLPSLETLRSKIVTRDIRTRDDVVRILENIASVSRNGDKVIITNQATITFKAIAHLAKTITFTLTSVDGKPALKDIKGISVGIGFVKKAITNYSP